MRQWIERTIRRIEYFFDWLEGKLRLSSRRAYFPPIEERDIVARYEHGDITVQVLEWPTDESNYQIRPIRTDVNGNCISDDILSYEQADQLMDALQDAIEFVGARCGSRRLQIVRLNCCERYIVDERLGELRNVNNPGDRMLLTKA